MVQELMSHRIPAGDGVEEGVVKIAVDEGLSKWTLAITQEDPIS